MFKIWFRDGSAVAETPGGFNYIEPQELPDFAARYDFDLTLKAQELPPSAGGFSLSWGCYPWGVIPSPWPWYCFPWLIAWGVIPGACAGVTSRGWGLLG
jgi:hypothetical protein